MLKDAYFISKIHNPELAQRLIETYVSAHIAYNMTWSILSRKYFSGKDAHCPKICDFVSRTIKFDKGE